MEPMTEERTSVLIVDDEESFRVALKTLLENYYEVFVARDAIEALAHLKRQACDVIVLDLILPGMSGLEFLHEVRKLNYPVEVVIITGFGALETAQEAIRLGACRYLTKPFRQHELRQAVRDALARRKNRTASGPVDEAEGLDQILLANLHAANHQLHATLDFKEVLGIIKDIVINLIGGDIFVLFLHDEAKKKLFAVDGQGLEWKEIAPADLWEGTIGTVLKGSRPVYYASDKSLLQTTFTEPQIIIPLRFKERIIGAIVIYSLLQQQANFSEMHLQLCELLAETMATACFTAKIYAESERKLNTIQGFLDLMKP